MTRDDIMRLAKESELWNVIKQHCHEYGDGLPTLGCYPELERFAALVATAEREACAQVCDDKVDSEYSTGKVDHNEMAWTLACAIAIRARGQA
jgi:hypothetical protein